MVNSKDFFLTFFLLGMSVKYLPADNIFPFVIRLRRYWI